VADCAITGQADDVSVQDHNITFDRSQSDVALDGGTCNANVVEDADGEHTDRYVQSDVEDDCFCLIFHEIDCVPTLERVQDERLVMSVLLPDRETLRELVDRMREVGASVSVQGITQSSAEGKESVMLDLTDVTGKQREALMVAIDTMGGVREIDDVHVEVALDNGAGPLALYREVILPGTLPQVFSAVSMGFSVGFALLVVIEMLAAESGLGYVIWNSWQLFTIPRMYVAVLTINVLGVVFVHGTEMLGDVLTPWEHGQRR
jgi:hypothetical protein